VISVGRGIEQESVGEGEEEQRRGDPVAISEQHTQRGEGGQEENQVHTCFRQSLYPGESEILEVKGCVDVVTLEIAVDPVANRLEQDTAAKDDAKSDEGCDIHRLEQSNYPAVRLSGLLRFLGRGLHRSVLPKSICGCPWVQCWAR